VNHDEGKHLRLLVVDDHMVVREGIRALAERTESLELVGEAASPTETLSLLAERVADVALVDYRLDNGSGLDLCAEIKRSHPDVHVVIFTAFGNSQLLTEAIRAGASGYVLKDLNTERLPEILWTIQERGSYFDSRLAGDTLLSTLRGDGHEDGGEPLSSRDLKILRLVAEGKSNAEIASALYLSPHTIKFHVTKLLRRFEVSRRSELAKVAADMFL
jgi:two-component system, NarL family, response regulator DevR